MLSKLLSYILPFWASARSYARKYTDSRLTGLVGLAYELTYDNGLLNMTIHDSRAVTAGITNGVFNLDNT